MSTRSGSNATGCPRRRVRGRSSGLLVSTLVGAVVLAGCSSVAERATEELIERGAGQSGTSVDIDRGGEQVIVENEDGRLTFDAAGEIPDAIRDALTLPVDLAVGSTTVLEENGNTFVALSGSLERDDLRGLVDELSASIVAAGWTVVMNVDTGGIHILGASRGEQELSIAITAADDRRFDVVFSLTTNAG
jgi:hypothetical protein